MQFHLGPAGNLRALPVIERTDQVAVTPVALGGIMTSLNGTGTQHVLGRRRSRWTLPWQYLNADDLVPIEALHAGLLGGPLRLIDPERPNLAHPRLATGGTEERTPDGWLATSGALDWLPISDPPDGVLAAGAITWQRSSTVAGDLAPGRTGRAYRAPVLDGMDVRVSMWVRATAGSFAAAFGVDHWDGVGALTTAVGSAAAVAGSWTELATVWTPSAGRVEVAPVLRIAASQPASTVQVTGVQMVYGSAAQPWRDGGGAPVVAIPPDGLAPVFLGAGLANVTLTVVEL